MNCRKVMVIPIGLHTWPAISLQLQETSIYSLFTCPISAGLGPWFLGSSFCIIIDFLMYDAETRKENRWPKTH